MLLLLVLKVPSPDATAIALVLKESILASLENPYWYLLLQRKQLKHLKLATVSSLNGVV